MSINEQNEIGVLTAQCKELEAQLSCKQNELEKAIMRKLTNDGQQHPLVSFLGQMATYDRPNKWAQPRSYEFTQKEADGYSYLAFNGIISGADVNSIYERPHYKSTDQFYSFVIPEELSEVKKGQPVPISDIYELLMFKVV
jgi:hypothetical protein